MNENIFEFVLSLISLLGAVITYFAVPYIQANIDSTKLEQYQKWAALAVRTAEMLWSDTGHGEDKKKYAVKFFNDMFNSKKTVITEEQIDILIESAVQELKKNM